jgi:protein-L-isoaspartate(D-aspartate) O-methyltransferase
VSATDREAPRRRLVEALEAGGALRDPRVGQAFLAVPRERFLPEVAARDGLEAVYADRAIVTRTDSRTGVPTSSSSQPAVMAAMLEALDLRAGHRVLEVGTGTGWNAALLAHLVGPAGLVTSVEIDADLADRARAALAGEAHVHVGDGHAGWPAGAPFDRIVATASTATVPRAWFDQLAPGGILVAPLRLAGPGVQAVAALRKEVGGLRSVTVVPGGFMSLQGPDGASPPTLTVTLSDGTRDRALVSLAGPGLAGMHPGPARTLAALLLEWERRGRPSAGDISVDVPFDPAEAGDGLPQVRWPAQASTVSSRR